jgi:hypothetical protein
MNDKGPVFRPSLSFFICHLVINRPDAIGQPPVCPVNEAPFAATDAGGAELTEVVRTATIPFQSCQV